MKDRLTVYRWLYAIFLLIISAFLVIQIYSKNWLQTDLQALLPEEQHWSKLQLQADKKQEEQFNRQVLALIGNVDEQQAFIIAENLAKKWEQSHLFSKIYSKVKPNLDIFREEINKLKLSVLPVNIQAQLLDVPQTYFKEYAEHILNPFYSNLLPLEKDLLGFGRFVFTNSPLSNIQWNSENGMFFIKQGNKTWVLIRAYLGENDLINPSENISHLISESSGLIAQSQSEWLITGAALFASDIKQRTEKESILMSIFGLSLTLLFLLIIFRTFKILSLLFPIGIGMLCGIAATILGFGNIHILTLAIGTSLIGILIDFPLHWMASSLFKSPWHGEREMKRLYFTFFISLLVTLLGYGLLGFTHLQILRQTALFSSVALICSVITTVLYLPLILRNYHSKFYKYQHRKIYNISFPFFSKPLFSVLMIILLSIGIYKSQWKDDIRQWVSLSPSLLKQAENISKIVGIELNNQYFLVVADSEQHLLEKTSKLSLNLSFLEKKGVLLNFQSLTQWIMTESEQTNFVKKLNERVTKKDYAILTEIGIPLESIENSLNSLQSQRYPSFSEIDDFELFKPWKPLYLGKLDENNFASIVKVSGVKDNNQLLALANQKDIFWQDKSSHLNQTFQEARNQAVWLKLFSFLLAGFLLLFFFGWKKSFKMLLIPVFSVLSVISIFGWINLPINLFSVFGLLLVSAISIDYIAYISTVSEPLSIKRKTISLAAVTSLISFGLLGLSSTPAVASFGWSVSLGILISLFTIFKVLR